MPEIWQQFSPIYSPCISLVGAAVSGDREGARIAAGGWLLVLRKVGGMYSNICA